MQSRTLDGCRSPASALVLALILSCATPAGAQDHDHDALNMGGVSPQLTLHGFSDVVFGAYDLPKPRLGPSLSPPPLPSEVVGDPDSLFHVETPSEGLSHKAKLHRLALGLLALLVAAAAAFAIASQREKNASS